MIGKTILHYKILEKLGEGGMGVVYKAEDTKLERTVALKFLSLTSIGDEEKKRFKREAKAAASLNHPNIATIHAIDEVDGQLFIAMEFIEGQSLAEMVTTPLPLDKAIDYATQVAVGLQAAHEKGIVHRDIKPTNVLVTGEGQVKIVDFGLAKLAGRTMLTKEGTTLGTAAYMSPEQTQGVEVDHRTDVWSLGVVLYEMITGQLPFKGDNDQVVFYSIVNEEQEPITALRTGVPLELERVVNKAMAKNPDERYQHVDEIAVDLKAVKAAPKSTLKRLSTPEPQPSQGKRIGMWGLAAIITAILVGVAVWEWLRPTSSTPTSVSRFHVPLPEGGEWETSRGAPTLALSPDSKHLVYVARNDKKSQLYLRPLDALQAKPLPGTEGALSPFFSPNGQWIGFLADGLLKKVRVAGGPPVRITDASGWQLGATWSSADVIVFALTESAGLFQVSAHGGKPKVLTTTDLDQQERSHRFPTFLPDGKSLLFMQIIGRSVEIWALSLQTGNKKFITKGTSPHYLPMGHLLYVYEGSLHAAPFDPVRLELTGPAVALFGGISGYGAGTDLAISNNGSLAYFTASGSDRQLILIDREGSERLISDEVWKFSKPRFSPDGRRLAVQITQPQERFDFWIYEFDQSTLSRLTFHGLVATAEWMPDGRRLTISANLGTGTFDIYSIAADFSGEMDTLITSEYDLHLGSWASDGQWLVYQEIHPKTGVDIWAFHSGGSKTPAPLLQTQYWEGTPRLSPDGEWLAYTSDESGQRELYVRPFPEPGSRSQISVAGATQPVWSPSGKELFYRQENKMMAAALEIGSAVKVVKRTELFEKSDVLSDYDIHPNGNQFVMVKHVEDSGPELIVVLNWAEELMRLVPGGR